MEWMEIIKQGGSYAISVLSLAALFVLWRHHTDMMKRSVVRHKERDDQYESIMRESITCITKNNTLLEIRRVGNES